LLASIGLKREDVYITNVVKCRPPGNRDPLPDEVAACSKYLDAQLELIKPKVIVTLGRHSMARFFPGARISQIHGQARRDNGIIYFPMYHPAAALHQQSLRATVEADMLKLPRLLAEQERVAEQEQPPPQATQLSLF
jgi:uracil-DNA glycosylase family 4